MSFNETVAAAQAQFNKKLKEAVSNRMKPVIMICGYTGAGKTTLAQSILGKSIVSDSAISHAKSCTMGFHTYTDDYVTLIDSRGLEHGTTEEQFVQTIRQEVAKRQESNNMQDHIHLVWYCISAGISRVTPTDFKLIKDIFPSGTVQVVITKSNFLEPEQREAFLKALEQGGIPKEKVIFVSKGEGDPGRRELVEKSLEILPQAYHKAFIAKQQVDLARKQDKAMEIIRDRAIAATLIGLIPFVDILLLIPIQIDMVVELADNYGLPTTDVEELLGPSTIAIIATSLASGSLMDFIPLLGTALSAVTAGQITATFGFLVDDYFTTCSLLIIAGNATNIPPFTFTAVQFEEVLKKEARKMLP